MIDEFGESILIEFQTMWRANLGKILAENHEELR